MKKMSLVDKINRLIFHNFLCRWLRIRLVLLVNRVVKKDSLNIGGGPNFISVGWLNLEEIKYGINTSPFKLTPDCRFPLQDSSVKVAYTSHCIEHLDNATIDGVLRETLRVLKKGGELVVKVPDFDLLLDAWKSNDESMFANELWSYNSIIHTWKNRNIEDCLDYRAVMFFCGFYNDAYGGLFGTNIEKDKNPYHGPPIVDVKFLRELIAESTPSEISKELSKIVMQNEKGYHFNHRNAWSRSEFSQLIESAGLEVITLDKQKILNNCQKIPGILEMKDQSMYCQARKN